MLLYFYTDQEKKRNIIFELFHRMWFQWTQQRPWTIYSTKSALDLGVGSQFINFFLIIQVIISLLSKSLFPFYPTVIYTCLWQLFKPLYWDIIDLQKVILILCTWFNEFGDKHPSMKSSLQSMSKNISIPSKSFFLHSYLLLIFYKGYCFLCVW